MRLGNLVAIVLGVKPSTALGLCIQLRFIVLCAHMITDMAQMIRNSSVMVSVFARLSGREAQSSASYDRVYQS